MDSGASRESHVGYHKDVSREDVSVTRIGMNGRLLQDHMKTREPAEDIYSGHRNSSTDEDANHKASSVLCEFLQQQAAPELYTTIILWPYSVKQWKPKLKILEAD